MIEVIYQNGIKERRKVVQGNEMHDPTIRDVLVFGGPRTHTGRLVN